MIRAPRRSLGVALLLSMTACVVIASLLLGGAIRDVLLVGGAALATALSISLLPGRGRSAPARPQAPDHPVALADERRARPPAPAPSRVAAAAPPESPLDEAVMAFQNECSELLLDAEAARVQTESCEGGVRAVEQASRSLAATCDVLGRRAGLTQSHALMARCATADAADCLRQAVDSARSWRQAVHDAVNDDGRADAGDPRRLGELAMASLDRAGDALGAALERADEAARVAAELGGAASRGQRHALNLSEACAGLAPSLEESARTGMRLAMLAASLDENAGRVSRMLGAAASGRRWPAPGDPAARWRESLTSEFAKVTGEDGNVVWVRFGDTSSKPGVEQA